MKTKRKQSPPAAYVCVMISGENASTCEPTSCTSFGRGEQIPKALVNCVNHLPPLSHTESPNAHMHAHLTAKPLPSIPFPAAEKAQMRSHVAASASFPSPQPEHWLRMLLLLLFSVASGSKPSSTEMVFLRAALSEAPR